MLNIFAIVINIFGRDANTIYITIFVEGEKLWDLIKNIYNLRKKEVFHKNIWQKK